MSQFAAVRRFEDQRSDAHDDQSGTGFAREVQLEFDLRLYLTPREIAKP